MESAQTQTQTQITRSRSRRLPTKYDFLKMYFFLFGFPKDGFISIDVTNKCNLRCRHCYFFEQDIEFQLKVDEWYERLLEMRENREIPFLQCTWVGGEPLLRQDLIDKGRKLFKYNTIVTNGSFPIPDWRDNVNFYISLDGDQERHDLVRNKPGLYEQIKKTIANSPVPVTLAYCINGLNKHSFKQVFFEWMERSNIKNFCFDFYTPIAGLKDDLTLSFDERDALIDEILALKDQYPDFLAVSIEAFRLMKSDKCREVTDNCLFMTHAASFDPLGMRKEKCMLGNKADCNRCGCVVPFYMHSLTHRPTVIKNTWFATKKKLMSLL